MKIENPKMKNAIKRYFSHLMKVGGEDTFSFICIVSEEGEA